MNLAVAILSDVTARSAEEAVRTLEVRLSLHVLRPFVRDQRLLTDFWKAATAEKRHPWTSCHLPYRRLVESLAEVGAPVDEAGYR
jgi:hypothetical protein